MEQDSQIKKQYSNIFHRITTVLFSSKRRLGIIIFIIMVIGGFFLWQSITQGNKKPQYQTAQVEKGTILSTVSENGNVAAGTQAGVGSPTTGIIKEIYVKDSDTVTQGQNLFKVKSIASAQEIASTYASYLSAQNSLNSAKAKMNSLQAALFKANQTFINDKGIPNPSDSQKADPVYIQENANWLQAEADYTNQKGVISQAQAAFTNAYLSYQATQDSIVTAPIDGTVANIAVRVGDQVSASSGNLSSSISGNNSNSSSSNSPVLYIGNFTSPYIKVQATEVDIPKIHAGQKATITLDAFIGKTFVGTVDQVDTTGAISSGVVTYTVFVSFVSPPSDVKPGMSATVTIQIDRKDDVLIVPSSAVQNRNGQTTVRVLEKGNITQVPVESGLVSDTDTEIISGLSEGQTIVTNIITPSSGSSATSSPFSGGLRLGGFGGGGGGRGRGGN